MSTPTIEQRIKKIVAEQLGIPEGEVKADSKIESDLGADSLARVELAMAIEDDLEVEISDEDLEQIITVQDAIDLATRVSSR